MLTFHRCPSKKYFIGLKNPWYMHSDLPYKKLWGNFSYCGRYLITSYLTAGTIDTLLKSDSKFRHYNSSKCIIGPESGTTSHHNIIPFHIVPDLHFL